MIPGTILAIENEDDRNFMENLYCSYRSLLYAEIMQIVHDPWNAEDVMQSVIVKLIDRISLLKKMDSRGLVNYLITAAKHTAYNFCRDSKPAVPFDDELSAPAVDSDMDRELVKAEMVQTLYQVWDTLDEKTRYLLQAKYILNLSAKEIGAELDMPPDNVRMALFRARRKARQAMDAAQSST